MELEVWKTIKGFEDYQISNQGRVKSYKSKKEVIVKGSVNNYGYSTIYLSDNGKRVFKKIHQLVAIEFLNHKPCGMERVVNHIDFNKSNNSADNLEIVSQRENTNRKHCKGTSKYTGVSWNKIASKWRAEIRIKGRLVFLGLFENELEASNTYQDKLKSISL